MKLNIYFQVLLALPVLPVPRDPAGDRVFLVSKFVFAVSFFFFPIIPSFFPIFNIIITIIKSIYFQASTVNLATLEITVDPVDRVCLALAGPMVSEVLPVLASIVHLLERHLAIKKGNLQHKSDEYLNSVLSYATPSHTSAMPLIPTLIL